MSVVSSGQEPGTVTLVEVVTTGVGLGTGAVDMPASGGELVTRDMLAKGVLDTGDTLTMISGVTLTAGDGPRNTELVTSGSDKELVVVADTEPV